jgi:hypothetical protein
MKVGAVSRPVKNRELCGDAYLFLERNNETLIAVIDGLGHGAEANKASQKALEYVKDHAGEDLEEIIRGCHGHIKQTRGVSLGLVRVDRKANRFSCCSVGNIETRILSKRSMQPISTAGVVGYKLSKIRKFEYPYESPGVVLLYSDGVSTGFDPSEYPYLRLDPQRAAEQIIEEWGKETDDATILIAVETQ